MKQSVCHRMHVAQAKAKRDRHADRQSDPYVALCFAGATINMVSKMTSLQK